MPSTTPSAGAATQCSRRGFTTGCLAAALSSAFGGVGATAQSADVPLFRSGRFQFTTIRPQVELPPVRLFGYGGKTVYLPSLRGRPILLNFWASWCDACRMELPVLDSLLGETNIHILAVSEDRAGRPAVVRFLDEVKIRRLPIYLDPNGYVAHSDSGNRRKAPFALYEMPITYVVASSGRVIGYMPGAADWTGPSAKRLLDYLRST